MTKSIVSGLGLLAVVAAIVLWLAGVYELSEAGVLALGFIGFVLAIFFARFGGFKPFFPIVETPPWHDSEQDGPAFNPTSIRRLAGVGADQTVPESLFDERSPDHLPSVTVTNRIFGDEDGTDNTSIEESGDQHPPLFAEALSEQLTADGRTGAPLFDQVTPAEMSPESGAAAGFLGDLQARDQAASERNEPLPEPLEIVVDVDPEWVGTGDQDAESASATAQDDAQPEESRDDDVGLKDLDPEDLAASLDSLEPPDPSDTSTYVDHSAEPMVIESTGLAYAGGTELPVVVENQVPLELQKYTASEIMSVVKSQEGVLVDTLIDQGVLSTSGPLTDKDIRTMVFVAVSSNELIDVLTQAQQDAVALNGGGNHALGTGD